VDLPDGLGATKIRTKVLFDAHVDVDRGSAALTNQLNGFVHSRRPLILIKIRAKCIKPRAIYANNQLQPHGRPGHRTVKDPCRPIVFFDRLVEIYKNDCRRLLPFESKNRVEVQVAICVDLAVIRVVLTGELTKFVLPDLHSIRKRSGLRTTAGHNRYILRFESDLRQLAYSPLENPLDF